MTHTIKSILVEARTHRHYKYYINNNLKDGYALKKDAMYKLLCEHIEPSLTSKVYTLLSKFQKFIIDIEKQDIYLIKVESEYEKFSKNMKSISLKNLNKIKKSLVKENLKNSNKLLLYSNTEESERLNQNLIDKFEKL